VGEGSGVEEGTNGRTWLEMGALMEDYGSSWEDNLAGVCFAF
jgi:hypothetical protein